MASSSSSVRYEHLADKEHTSLEGGRDDSALPTNGAQESADLLAAGSDSGDALDTTNDTHVHDALVPTNRENDDDEVEITIDAAIERIGMGPFQVKILIASGLCFAADAMQVVLLSFLAEILKEDWQLTTSMTEAMTSILFAGSFLGTITLGPLADSMGRRPVFLLAAGLIAVFGVGVALAPSYLIIVGMIFVVGVGVGGLTVPFDLLSEVVPAEGRGRNLLLIEYFWTAGCLFVVVLAYVTLHSGGDHWRTFVALCTIPCSISFILGLVSVPESPRWLCSQARTNEALEILKKAAKENGHVDEDGNQICFPPNVRLRVEGEEHGSLADLFTPQWREITIRLWGTWWAFAFGYYGALLAITRVFESTSAPTDGDNDDTSGTYDFDYFAIFLSSAAELVGTTLVILLVDRFGRISSQIGCVVVAGICLAALCVLAGRHAPRELLIIVGFVVRVFEMGGTCVAWVSAAEILTTEVRATGHSTANAMARLGAFFSPFLIEGDTPLLQVGLIMLIMHFFTVVCVIKLPETKGKDMGSANVRLASHEPLHDGAQVVNTDEIQVVGGEKDTHRIV